MAPKVEDDWSDEDEELTTDVETDVLLGVPDGPIASSSDMLDVAVSRIGGTPVCSALHVSSSRCNRNSRICSDTFISRPSSSRVNRRFRRATARTARGRCSCSCRSGVRSRTARWTVRCMSGAAPRRLASVRKAGERPVSVCRSPPDHPSVHANHISFVSIHAHPHHTP
jgi:hypothetical protein